MKTSFRSLLAAGMLLRTVVAEEAVEYARLVPMIGIPTSATDEQRAAAEKLGGELGIIVHTFGTNPVCCIWLELRAWRPNPGTDGYVIIHQAGGTIITASSQQQLNAAVERLLNSLRERDGKREAPVGLMTSYEIIAGISFLIPSAPFPPKARGRRGRPHAIWQPPRPGSGKDIDETSVSGEVS